MMYDELKGLDPAQIHFALTPCARWDTKNKCVWRDKRKNLMDAHMEDMSGLKPFYVVTWMVPRDMSVADFLRSKMEDCYVVIYPESETEITAKSHIETPEGSRRIMRLIRMATLDKKIW